MDELHAWLHAQGVSVTSAFLEAFRQEELTDRANILEHVLNSDLRHVGAPSLPNEFNQIMHLAGPTVLQVLSIHNIAQPAARQTKANVFPKVLQLRLTDGAQKVTAIEVEAIPKLSVGLAPGTKLAISDCPVRNGKLLLSASNCKVLGGRVHELFTSWKANNELKEKKRLAGADKADPPPVFTDFVVEKKSKPKEGKAKTKTKETTTTSEAPKESTAQPAKATKAFNAKTKSNQKPKPFNSKQRTSAPKEDAKADAAPRSVESKLNAASKEFIPMFLQSNNVVATQPTGNDKKQQQSSKPKTKDASCDNKKNQDKKKSAPGPQSSPEDTNAPKLKPQKNKKQETKSTPRPKSAPDATAETQQPQKTAPASAENEKKSEKKRTPRPQSSPDAHAKPTKNSKPTRQYRPKTKTTATE